MSELSSEPALKKNLIYTVIMDAPGAEGYRFLGKMLVSSLLRTFFTGDIVVFRNCENPLFLVERKGLEEVYVAPLLVWPVVPPLSPRVVPARCPRALSPRSSSPPPARPMAP